jgi:hypothetical protein
MSTPGDVNVFHGARQFMHRWDFFKTREAPSAHGRMRIASRTSGRGNINIGGTESSSLSAIYVASQDGFLLTIEPGVRSLVSLLAYSFDLITYTSCEGHTYPDGRRPDVRCVGVLPRDKAELQRVSELFGDAASRWSITNTVEPMTAEFLMRELVDRQAKIPALDLVLRKRPACSWEQYFDRANACTATLHELLSAMHAGMPWKSQV